MDNNNKIEEIEIHSSQIVFEDKIYQSQTSSIYRSFLKGDENSPLCVKMRDAKLVQETQLEERLIKKFDGITPRFFGSVYENNMVMLMIELLNQSLDDVFSVLNKRFALRTLGMLGIQMLDLVEDIHSRGYLHGKLTPQKFMIGFEEEANRLFLVGFSHAKRFMGKNKLHSPKKKAENNSHLVNEFSSINVHKNITPSRRDDIESLAYILLYFNSKGDLFKDKNIGKGQNKWDWKFHTKPEELYPKGRSEIIQILNYARNLDYEDEPNYDQLKKYMQKMIDQDINTNSNLDEFEWYGKNIQAIDNPLKRDDFAQKPKKKKSFETIIEDPRENLQSSVFDTNSFVSIDDIQEAMQRKVSYLDPNQIVNADTNDTTYRVLDHYDSSDDEDGTTTNSKFIGSRKASFNGNTTPIATPRKISIHDLPTPKMQLGSIQRIRKMPILDNSQNCTEEGNKAFGESSSLGQSLMFKSPFDGRDLSPSKRKK